MFFRFLEFGNIGLLGSIFSSKTPYKFFKFLDLFSFVKSTCKKFAKKSGKKGKGFANPTLIKAFFYRNFSIEFKIQNC
jgi:hypothetical protein